MPDIEGKWYEYRWQLLAGLLGLILFVAGLISVNLKDYFTSEQFEIVENTETAEIVVEVSGAVSSPGVYSFDYGGRVEDAIIAAGGFSDNVDAEYVEKIINRAALLEDGQKIYFPSIGEQSTLGSAKNNDANTPSVVGQKAFININTASKSELESMWGIGPATAQNVIENRPYSSVGELLEKKILKSNVYERNKDQLTVY